VAPGQFQPGVAPGQFQPGVAPGQFQPGQIQQPGVARGAFGTQPGVVAPGVTSPGLLPPGTVTPGQAPPGRPLPGAPLPRTAAPRVGDPITPGTVTPGTPGGAAIPGRPGTFVGPQGTGTAFPRAPLPGEVQPTVPGPGAISPQAPFPGQIQPTVPGPDAIRPQPPGAEFPGAPVPETFTPAPGLGVPMAGEIQARQQAADRALAHRIHTSVARPTTGPGGVITTPRVTNLQVASQRGVVTLRGTVTTPQERQMIGRQVERMPGVWGVNNEIQVVAPGLIPR
jgi:hypothetical protein